MTATTLPSQDYAARFVIDTLPVHGRLVRLDETLNRILDAHDYPEPVATLLGEACVLAVLVGSALKFDGRLIMQAQGRPDEGGGPVRYVVADYDTRGTLRGFCRYDEGELTALQAANAGSFQSLGAMQLLGKGTFIMTLEPDAASGLGDRYQGVTPIEGDSLSLCAEYYFAQSEQVPTQIKLAVSHVDGQWRAGGAMIQATAGDDSRGDTKEAFEHIRALFATLGEDELTDFDIDAERLLYRLFHEDGVRLSPPKPIAQQCRCSQERVEDLVKSFPAADQEDMVEADGQVHITCEYCSKTYYVAP
ncbi:Hsp33 family molecular chaperone HslO [Asticcacaulis sp. YBE204]|uniref:Hsp33 family molecular chaperone HslO n=1 Tax=Asticcacaulis sp. YBE204 TaxID=1282363 RepID=UPI0003C40ABC|nr:Hsp33 family molecular chaperone HslO [Asticcacaulis sp. YBE204]ESQ81151.1 molecular chaperone Hsp33 [Asticcacaulis sp. YBE204]